ncbi:MAG: lysophospholipid acyltransferase family protein [Candidatus Eisenbacteria bacterium]|nr:lysophospholipid acyltransferase family protein [Candidatus Eisenbacteria bacterium]
MLSRSFFRLASATASLIPLTTGYFLARLLVPFHIYCFPRRRQAVNSNLLTILKSGNAYLENGKSVRELRKEIFTSFNYFLFEFFRTSSVGRETIFNNVSVQGSENLDSALSEGKGAIIVASHIGNWEIGGTYLALSGYKLNVVAGAQLGKWLSPQVRNMKERFGIDVISPEKGYRDLFLALNRNEIVVLLVDGNLYSAGFEVEFFGRKTLMPRGPAVLSIKTGAPIVPAHVVRRGRFRFSIDIMAPVHAPQGEKDIVAEELTEHVVSIQEKDVAEHLGQWCIFRSVWS